MARYMSILSVPALRQLVEQDPVLHIILDLRSADTRAADPLPESEQYQSVTATLDAADLYGCLKDASTWAAASPEGPPHPTANHLLVFLTDTKEQFEEAASAAARCNYHRCLQVEGAVAGVAAAAVLDITFINRDAAAHLLELEDQKAAPEEFMFVDLRRSDERVLYGGIPGSVHIPVELFVFAIQGDAQRFEEECRVPAPAKDQLLILQCRSNRRAGWAARIAQEQGYSRVMVYKQGSYGWRLDAAVKAYGSYEVTDEPPDAEEFAPEEVDAAAAVAELQALGIVHT